MSSTDIQQIFEFAQVGRAKHKKYLQALHKIYQKYELKDFLEEFMQFLSHAFNAEILNPHAKAVMSFASSFCVEIVTEYEKHMKDINPEEDYDSHPFFIKLVCQVLQYVDLKDFNVRYHACEFIAMVLGNFGSEITINDEICDKIQRALLQRIVDSKPQVRTEAIKVLVRLQNPCDINCPVIKSFIDAFGDPAAHVRKTIVENIAPCKATFSHIITRLRDVDASVRTATFIKLSKITPRSLTIVYRQTIITSGLLEPDVVAKRNFEQVLLPKWLKIYDSNVIVFMNALKLDANEEDIKLTETIYQKLLPIFFKMLTLQELLALLGLDNANLIPIGELNMERMSYWSYFLRYIKNIDTLNMEIDNITPVLTEFVIYIDSYSKFQLQQPPKRWEYLQYQQVLHKLFELLPQLDISDEFGRQAMEKFIISMLTNVKVEYHVIGMIIKAFHAIVPDVDKLAYELCSVIEEIRDPLEAVQPPADVIRNQEVQIAQLKVARHVLTNEMKEAVEQKQYDLIEKLSKDGVNLEKQLKELEEKFNQQPVLVRKPHNDVETTCRCMDIVLACMENIPIVKLPVPFLTFKNEFLTEENCNQRVSLLFEKIFKMTCVYSILDKNIATENLGTICTPVIEYRRSNVYTKKVLEIAIYAISDLIRIYGPNIFDNLIKEHFNESKTTDKTKRRANDRTLYSEDAYDSDSEVSSVVNLVNATPGILIDTMLSMLDDSDAEIRALAAEALSKLVVRGLCVNSSLITRLLLKWFNPILDTDDKLDQKVQRYLGTAISRYVHDIKDSHTVLEKAIIPTMCFIGNAPKTSPLADVIYDDVLQCLIKFTKIRENIRTSIHKNVAYAILSRVAKTNEPAVRILTKMLTFLDIHTDEPSVVKELSQQINFALDTIGDKVSIGYLKKFFNKLNGISIEVNNTANTTDGVNATTRLSGTPAKGRKRRGSSNTIVENDDSNNTTMMNQDTDGRGQYRSSSGTPGKTNRRLRSTIQTDLETINEQRLEETGDGNLTLPSGNGSGEPSESISKHDEIHEKRPASVKRKKIRGSKNSFQAVEEPLNQNNLPRLRSRRGGSLSAPEQDVVFTQSSSDTESS